MKKTLFLLLSLVLVLGLKAQTVMNSVDFEDGTTGDWTIIQNNPNQTWGVADVTAGNGNDTSKYANILYDDNLELQDEYLVSPVLDFSDVTQANITFLYMMSYHWGVDPNDNYDVNLVVSTDDGENWTEIWDENMDPEFDSTDDNYIFRSITVDLSSYAGNASVKVAFQYLGTDGAQAGVDEIVITDTSSTSSVEDLEAFNFNAYPNPVNDVLNMTAANQINHISIINLLGQEVISTSPNALQTAIDTSDLSKGVYMVNVEIAGVLGSFKIVKE